MQVLEGASIGIRSFTGSGPAGSETGADAIDILIPGEKAALTATFTTPDGRERRVFVRSPMVSVIPPGHTHRLHCQEPADVLVLSIAPGFFEQQARAALGTEHASVCARYAAIDPFIRQVGESLQSELRHSRMPSEAYLRPLASVMAIHLARHYAAGDTPAPASGGLPQHKLSQVKEYIASHLGEPLLVADLAKHVHLSPFHFARMFKQSTGQPPHLYVLLQRVQLAKRLLQDTDIALRDVAVRAGFRTQGHFTGVFHRYAGVTPRAWRMACRAKAAQEAEAAV